MSKDITPILEGWDFRPDRPPVRRITGDDGRPKIQLRIDLGLLQMEEDGRPDGNRPYGHETILAHYRNLAHEQRDAADGAAEFELSEEDCMKLQHESMQFYYRRISWLELGEYRAAERDAEHNLGIIEFVNKFARTDHLRDSFTQWKPFILVHRTMARARQAWEQRKFEEAVRHIREGIDAVAEAYRETGREDAIESSGEITYLRKWADEIEQARPLTLEQRLERELNDAVEKEAFERAALLRDRLSKLREDSGEPQ